VPTIAERLRDLRIARVLTQEALGRKSGVSQVTIARIESGKYAPRFSTIHKLAEALGITAQEFVEGIDLKAAA
jgi:transcriptional regulator with XRE-family HTH domain